MRKILIAIGLIAGITGAMNYVVLNSLGETFSIGSWGCLPQNDIHTVDAIPNQIISYCDAGIYVLCSGSSTIQRFRYSAGTGSGTASLEEEFILPIGSNPYLMYCNIEEGKIYTSLWIHGGIGIIDLSSGDVTVVEPFCLGPQGIIADDDYIYVTAGNLDPITFAYGDGQLYRLTHEGIVVDSIIIGLNPQQIIYGPDGNLHIVCTGDYFSTWGMIYIVNPVEFSIIDSFAIGGSPQRLVLDYMTDIIYSATSVWGIEGSGKILAYNGIAHEVIFNADDTNNTVRGTGLIGLTAFDNTIIIPSMDSSWLEIVEFDGSSITPNEIFMTGYGPNDVDYYGETGVAEGILPEKSSIITASPNPFNGTCRIHVSGVSNQVSEIEIFDLDGKSIANHTHSALITDSQLPITEFVWRPDESVPAGIYLVRVNIGGKTVGKAISYIK